MWRTAWLNPVLVAVAVAVAVGCCRAGHADPHGREAALAVGIALAASAVAVVVLGLGRSQPPTPAGPAATALLAMVSHLAVTGLLAVVVLMTTGVAAVPFAYWVLGLFWVTLLGLAAGCLRVVRAPVSPR